MSLSPAQSRAARAWLENMSQAALSEASGVSISAIKDFESGARKSMRANLEAVERALLQAGAGEFLAATSGLAASSKADGRAAVVKESESPVSKTRRPQSSKRVRRERRA